MSVLKTLRDKIAPELNHLYTAPAAEAGGILDPGWHSREHALHAFFVARMFGAPAEIIMGDYAIISRYVPPLTSMGTNVDHAWCSVNEVVPVDLGLTFHHYGAAPQLRTPIAGDGPNGDWHIEYSFDESPLDESVQDRNEILFIEKTILPHGAEALLADPFLLLAKPALEDAEHFATRHGPGIYAKITLHCFACAMGRAKSVRPRLNRAEAVAWIAQNYADADALILQTLQKM